MLPTLTLSMEDTTAKESSPTRTSNCLHSSTIQELRTHRWSSTAKMAARCLVPWSIQWQFLSGWFLLMARQWILIMSTRQDMQPTQSKSTCGFSRVKAPLPPHTCKSCLRIHRARWKPRPVRSTWESHRSSSLSSSNQMSRSGPKELHITEEKPSNLLQRKWKAREAYMNERGAETREQRGMGAW